MKVKQRPEDFIVEELTDTRPGSTGPFAFYRLEKVGWTTHDAVGVIRRRWQLPAGKISYGGLKDRHARTVQYLSIFHGPQRNLSHSRLELEYLGQVEEAFQSEQILANRFGIVLRDLRPQQAERLTAEAGLLEAVGTPNYFDDQRFGSMTRDGRFVAAELVKGEFESALKLALAAPYEHDRAAAKREKEILRQHWGDWPRCKDLLPKGHARSLIDYLKHHPTDFRGACARLRAELASLYLSAYQSALWNRVLDGWLRGHWPAEQLGVMELKSGRHAVPLSLPAGLEESWPNLTVPLPSARLKPLGTETWLPTLEKVLEAEGLTLKGMKIPGLNRPYFSKGERLACLKPSGWQVSTGNDELNPKRVYADLRFELPRGAYATMIIKRLTAVAVLPDEPGHETTRK